MLHVKPYQSTRERIVHAHSQAPDSGFAVVLPSPTLGQSSPDLTSSQLLHKEVCPHHCPAGVYPVSPLSVLPKGLRADGEEQGAESPRCPCPAHQHLLNLHFKGRPPDPQLQAPQFGKQMLYHRMFSEGYIVYPSGCCLALCYKILYFSFLLFSSAVLFFFPWIY